MKVLFISDQFSCDPLGIAWLSAYLRHSGHYTAMLVMNGSGHWDVIGDEEPDMLCYSVTTGKHLFYKGINEVIRKNILPDAFSVFGGPHVTFFPEYIEGRWMDAGVRGEGFASIVDLAFAFERLEAIDDLPNVVVGGKINPLRPLLNKDDMLLPDREIIYQQSKNRVKPIKSIMASFNCVFQCPYCFNGEWKELYGSPKVQVRPVESIMAEIEALKRYPVERLYFEDDVFPVYKTDWLDEFCSKYDRRLPFHIHLRAEYINEPTIKQLKAAGLHSVTFAIESGNENLRRTVLKRNMRDERITNAAQVLHKYDINFRTQNMIGIPHETWTTALETLRLNIECSPTMGWASIFQPYPGTALGKLCREEGLFNGDLDDITPSFFDKYRLNVPHKKRYERLQKLFGFAVRHPRLGKKLVPFLSHLPFSYSGLHNRYKRKLNQELYEVVL